LNPAEPLNPKLMPTPI